MKNKYKTLLKAAIPLFLSQLTSSSSSIIDNIIAGKFIGEKALAACGLCDPVYSFCSIISGLCTFGVGISVFKLLGSGNQKKGSEYFTSIFVFAGIFSFIIVCISILFCDPVVAFITNYADDKELVGLTKDLYIGLICGIVFSVLYCVIMPISQINSKNKTIASAITLSLITNVTMDIFTVWILKLNTLGIGISTALGYLVTLITLIPTVWGKNKTIHFAFRNLKISYFIDVAKQGSPYAVRRAFNVLRKLTFNYYLIAANSTAIIAGFATMCTCREFYFAYTIALGNSIAIITGYYVGLKNKEYTQAWLKASIRLTMIVGCVITVLIVLISPLLAILFTDFKSEAYFYSIIFICFSAFCLPFYSYSEVHIGYLTSIGKKLTSNIFMVIQRGILPVVSLYVLNFLIGFWAIPFTFIVVEVISALMIKFYNIWLNKSGYYNKLFANKNFLNITVTNKNEISNVLNKSEQFFNDKKVNHLLNKKLRLCLEEIINYTIIYGFKDEKNNYLAINVVLDDNTIQINLQDNCRKFSIFDNIPAIINSSNENMVGLKLVIKIAEDIKKTNLLDLNNFQIKLNNNTDASY